MMRSTFVFVIFVTVASGVSADESSRVAAQAKQIFRTRCLECHGEVRRESDINIFDLSTYVGEDRYLTPGDVDSSYLYELIVSADEDVRMPKGPLPTLRPDEVETIRRWISQGALPFPDDVEVGSSTDRSSIGTDYVLSKIATFSRSIPLRERRYFRFFSSNHLLNTGATAEDLRIQKQALAKAVNHLSWSHDIVQPLVIDEPVGSVFAVDIRKPGWFREPFRVVGHERKQKPIRLNLFDLVLLEYPYGVTVSSSVAFDEVYDLILRQSQMIRPIPFIRTDWFASIATQSPLYEDLLELPSTLPELERELGVHFETNVEAGIAFRAGMTVSGVSRNNRVVERHPAKYGAYWKSFDFETSRGQQNIFIDPIGFHFAGGEMIWNLPNGLQAYLITDAAGNRILEAPTSIVTDKFAEDKVVRNGLACMRCHDRGMKRFADNIRPAFKSLPDRLRPHRADVLALYVDKKTMDEKVRIDQSRFLNAMTAALGEPQSIEPLTPVSRRFLDAPVTLSQAAGELGLHDSHVLRQIFRLPEFTQLGLASLTTGGVVRRDTWEDYFDRVVNRLGEGTSIVPLDGLIRTDHLSDGLSAGLTIKTNRSGNTFAPNDEMVVTVTNDTGQDQFIELLGTDSKGVKTVLSDVALLKRSQSYRFPQTGTIRIQPQLGKEFITVFASPEKFHPGTLLRAERVADRFVHPFYSLTDSGLIDVPSRMIKKTIIIETR